MGNAVIIRYKPLETSSIPERELQAFVSSVTELLGIEQTRVLTEIWLDELASMEVMPEPMSTQWRLVTLGAWSRLAGRLFDGCLRPLTSSARPWFITTLAQSEENTKLRKLA